MTEKKKGSRIWGYARVSTEDQDMSLQIAALERFGVDGVIKEKASGKTMKRKVFELLMHRAMLRPGDTLVVWKLDRLGRDLMGVLEVIEELNQRGVKLVSITDGFDARTPMGRAMMQISLVFAELERNLISERTKAGMRQRMAEGVKMGPKSKISDNEKRIKHLRKLDAKGKLRDESGDLLMSRATLIDILNAADPKAQPIKSDMTIRRWQSDGYTGLDKKEQP